MEEPVLDTSEVEPAQEAPVEAAPVEEAPPAWAGPSQDDWAALTGRLEQLDQRLQPAPVEPVQPGVTDYFPVDPVTGEASLTLEGLSQFVNDQIQAGVQERLGQFEPVLNQTVADRGEQQINQLFDTLAQQGDFDRGIARELAEGYAQMGFDANEAIKRGADRARDFAQAQRQAGVEEYKTTLQNIGQAPREPGVNGAGIASDDDRLPVGHPDRYKQIADNWAARNRIS